MKTIRSNCFETNSSSTHSLTLDNSRSPILITHHLVGKRITCGEFGWEFRSLKTFEDKCSYFWTLAQNQYSTVADKTNELRGRLERLADIYKFILVEPSKEEFYYVDHGFEHYDKFIRKYPSLATVDGLFSFLFSDSAVIFLGNDNECDPPNFRFTDYQIKTAKKRVKITFPNGESLSQILATDESFSAVSDVVTNLIFYADDKNDFSDGYFSITEIADGVAKVVCEKFDYAIRSKIELERFEVKYEVEDNI